MSKLERAVNLLVALIETERPLSRVELFDRVPGYENTPASRRAFERDKEMLRSIGVPLSTEQLDSDQPDESVGYRVPKADYQLAETGLTREEMTALAVAAAAVRLEDNSTTGALLKLGATPETSVEQIALEDDDRLADLFVARRDRSSATFTYNAKKRTVDPYRLSFRNGHWYMTGLDHTYEHERTYRVDRIEGDIERSAHATFDAPPKSTQTWLPAWRIGEGEPIHVRLLVDADHAELVERQTGTAATEDRRNDGSIVVGFDVVNREAFTSWVLDFLDHAEIIEPVDVRDAFVARLRHMAGAQ